MDKQQVLDAVNWEKAMAAPRYSGGYEDVMRSLFEGSAEVIAEWIESDYQGEEAFAYRFGDGTIVLITDYFGSCSGCDSWEDASDEDARSMIHSMVTSSRVFPGLRYAVEFLETVEQDAAQFSHRSAKNLLPALSAFAEPAPVVDHAWLLRRVPEIEGEITPCL